MLKKACLVLTAVAFVSALTSCSNVKESKEYQTLQSEVTELDTAVKNLEVLLEEAKSAPAKLEEIKNERLKLREQVSSILENPEKRKIVRQQIGIAACEKYIEVAYESTGRVDLDHDENTAFWADVYSHLSPAEIILGDTSLSSDDGVGYTAYIQELKATDCMSTGANAFWNKCETFDKKIMNKNPDAFIGKCVTGSVSIAQWDTNTGPCSFQGYLGGGYDVRAQFGEILDPNLQSAVKKCDWLSDYVEGNYITFWGLGIGTYSYETTSGGKQTIPAFKVLRLQG